MLVIGTLVGKMSGKLGALVASHNAGGAYLRQNVVPTNPATPQQNEVRVIVGALTVQWNNTLTQVQRDAWDNFGQNVARTNRIGQTIHLSGIAEFVRANVPRLQVGLSQVNDAPTIFTGMDAPVIEPGSLVVDQSSNNIQLVLPAASNPYVGAATSAVILASLSAPQNVGKKFFKGPYQSTKTTEAPTTSALSIDNFTATYPIVAGTRAFVTLQVTHADGRLSEKSSLTAIAQA